jgi:hypothetical protein
MKFFAEIPFVSLKSIGYVPQSPSAKGHNMRLVKLSRIACIAGALAAVGCGDDSESGGSTGSTSQGSGGGGQGGDGSTSQSSGVGGNGGSTPLDACAAGTDNCDDNATCVGLPDGFQCECHPGYTGDGATCADVDECSIDADNCGPSAICTNTPGSFTCACPEGYEGPEGEAMGCTDIDECTAGTDNCASNAKCTNTQGAFTCTCPPGTKDVGGNGTACSVLLGENCVEPIDVTPQTLPTAFAFDTTGASADLSYGAGRCPGDAASAGAASSDRVYRLTPTTSGDYVFNLTSTGFDGSLYVVTNCGDIANSCVGARNTACSNCTESLTVSLTAGTTYFAVVDGASDTSNAAGAYRLEVIRPKSFSAPIQFDMSEVLLNDTILNNGAGEFDPTQESIDQSTMMLITQSAAQALDPSGVGLPDDAFFGVNTQHPDVQLHWRNDDNGVNSRFLRKGESFTFSVPMTTYTEVQVYGLATEGGALVDFVLTYSDGTTDTRNVKFIDWFNDPPAPGQFFLIDGLDRYGSSGLDVARDPAISGVNLAPNKAKQLVSIKVAQPSTNYFVFFGALGY